MKSKGFYIKSIIATGDGKETTQVDFKMGCNLIFGPSDTGKSAVFSVINFLLGKNGNPKEVPEGDGYDVYYMEFITLHDDNIHTAKRKLNEKKILVKECCFSDFDKNENNGTLYVLSGKKNSYSNYLMSLNGHSNELELKKSSTKKIALTFTWIKQLILANETRIVSEEPVFNPSGQFSNQQLERSLIYYLTTGIDDKSFTPAEREDLRTSRIQGMIEITNENIKSIESRIFKLGDVSYADFEDDAAMHTIQSQLDTENSRLNQLHNNINADEEKKRVLLSKILFVREFLKRITILEKHYLVDISRYEYLNKGRTLFDVIDEIHECPICHSEIEDSSKIDDRFKNAISEGYKEVASKLADIRTLVDRKRNELIKLETDLKNTEHLIRNMNLQMNSFVINLHSLKNMLLKYQENIEKKSELKYLNNESRRLYTKLAILNEQVKGKSTNTGYIRTTNINDDFCEILKTKLMNWNIIDNVPVVFNEDSFDFVFGGKKRTSCGKGTRGVTCSAILMTLLEFCDKNNIPFSSLLVLDSPLTAHFDDEIIDVNEITQTRFFNYCNDHISNYQLIIFDNKSPNKEKREILNNIHYIDFSEEGKNGFYPKKTEDTN